MWSFSSQVTLHSNTQACLQSIDIAVYFCASFLRVKCQKLVKMLSKIHTLGNTRISTDDAQKCISPQHCTAQWCMKMKLRMASSKLDVMNSRNMLTNTVLLYFKEGETVDCFDTTFLDHRCRSVQNPPSVFKIKCDDSQYG